MQSVRVGKIHYAGSSGRRQYPVIYKVFGQQIIFTGLKVECPSTRHSATEIVWLIATQEGIIPATGMFFDLQTRLGYPELRPGKFIFSLLVLEQFGSGVRVVGWKEGVCHPLVLQHFQGYISDSDLGVSLQNVSPSQGVYQPIQACE